MRAAWRPTGERSTATTPGRCSCARRRATAGSPDRDRTHVHHAPVAHAPELRLSLAQARRIALAAQGFDNTKPHSRVTMRQLQRVIDRIGLIQIDSVNVIARSHLMPLFSRLGEYDPKLIERASSRRPRRLVEYWAHEASFIPPETHRMLRWRMAQADDDAWGNMRCVSQERPEVVEAVLEEIDRSGAITA